jgi:hypothetical protein
MAVEMTDIQSLLKNVDLKSILGSTGMAETSGMGIGGGVLGAVLVGALLPRLLGNENGLGNAATAAALTPQLTTADVSAIVTGAQNSQTLGNVEGEIWKAEGQVQAALAASTNAAQLATLQAEIANLQGQGLITKSISDSAAMNATQHGLVIQATQDAATNLLAATAASNLAIATGFNTLNTNVLQGTFATTTAVYTDGEKTRSAIALLAASIPNARELDLQRQLTVALDDHRHSNTRASIDSGNVSVVTNVAQSQAQTQQQQQAVIMNGLLGQLVAAQHATNTAVTIGNGNRPTQTASNVNA